MKTIIKILLLMCLSAQNVFAVSENLDELYLRKSRMATATWGKEVLESPAPAYVWQPETMIYTDVKTGSEVMRFTGGKNLKNSLPDLSFTGFSADGKRFAFGSHRDTSACESSFETNPNYTYEGSTMLVRSDGSYLRPADGAPFEVMYLSRYLNWSPTEPDVYYGFTKNKAGEGLPLDNIYRVVVSDTGLTKTLVADTDIAGTPILGRSISSDGTQMLILGGDAKYYFADITPPTVTFNPAGWDKSRQLDPYWSSTPATTSYDMHFSGLIGNGEHRRIYVLPNGYNSWWRYNLSGTAADGGPQHISDHLEPYAWGEIEPVLTGFGSGGNCGIYKSPWNCDSDLSTGPDQNMSHSSFDKWGKYLAGVNSQYSRGMGVWDLWSHSWVDRAIPITSYDWHTGWDGWTDWFLGSPSKYGANPDNIMRHKYDGTASVMLASTHLQEMLSTDYNSLPRATQSPDGTKAVFHADFLYSIPNAWDIFFATAYYPHPPEITSVTGSGTYTIRFDWRLGTESPRGYTKRGWPDEDVNDPPPPRETRLFRLWRSSTGAVGSWEPVAEVPANIFSRYNFSTGAWTGNDYWTISDTPGAGTWYYAVTSQEWSGLASRALSNVFSTAGAQTAAYPADPGAKVPFTTAFQEGIIRGWNVYASDAGTPAAVQQNRIATIPTASPKEYIDWLANPTATTYYTVVALDSQGFESAPLTITVTPSLSGVAGRNKITWTSEVDPTPDPVCGDVGSPGLCTTEGDCTAVGFNWCSGACQIGACPVLPAGAYPAYAIPGAGAVSVGGRVCVTN